MLIQSKKNRTSFYLPFLLGSIGTVMCIGNSLVGAKLIVVLCIAINYVMKLAVRKYQEMVQAFPSDRADKSFRVAIHVGRVWNSGYAIDAERFIVKVF